MALSTGKKIVELLDLPDEILLIIMQKVGDQLELFHSLADIGNERLQYLAFDQCSSIDLTTDFDRSPQRKLVLQFFLRVLPRIHKRIHSFTINIRQVGYVNIFAKAMRNKILPSLTQLKIMRDLRLPEIGTPVTIARFNDSSLRRTPLFSSVPELFFAREKSNEQLLDFLHSSPTMDAITSFELDKNWILSMPPSDRLLFPRSSYLTDVHVTLGCLTDCIHLLRQLGSQLCSFTVGLVYIHRRDLDTVSKLATLCCPKLRLFSLRIYRNLLYFEESILPLLQHLSTVKHLQLFLAIGMGRHCPNHFIDGLDLQRDIISYMPHLRHFDFHIRSIVRNAPPISLKTIQESFVDFQQPVHCALHYFNNDHGQCHVLSLPFHGNRLDLISNRFPLFDVPKTFSHVTTLFLFDDVKPFEHVFFERVARTLPHLRTLEINNELAQQEKMNTPKNNVELPRLMTLLLHDIHVNYAEEMLCRSHLPYLVELAIRHEPLLAVINQDQQQARENCSHIRFLETPQSNVEPTNAVRTFFPLVIFHNREK